jgi:hypothetical protein
VLRTGSLALALALKDSGDPRAMMHEPDACVGRQLKWSLPPRRPALTGDDGLHPGPHRRRIGTLLRLGALADDVGLGKTIQTLAAAEGGRQGGLGDGLVDPAQLTL